MTFRGAVLGVGLSLLWPAAAWAADDEAATEDPRLAQARAAFLEGTELSKQGQWVEALEAYQRSAGLHRHAATTYNVGYCLRALGRYTKARVALRDALAWGESHPGELPDRLRADAERYLRELEEKIVRLAVTVQGEPILVSVDGRPVQAEQSGTYIAGLREVGEPAPVPDSFTLHVDPGEHAIVVKQRGEQTALTVSYEAGTVEKLTLGTIPVAAPVEAGYLPGAYTAWAIGGVGVVAGVVTGAIALETKGSLDAVCATPDACPEEEQSPPSTGCRPSPTCPPVPSWSEGQGWSSARCSSS